MDEASDDESYTIGYGYGGYFRPSKKPKYQANPKVHAFEKLARYHISVKVDGHKSDKVYKELDSFQIVMSSPPISDFDHSGFKKITLLFKDDCISCMLVLEKGKDFYGFAGKLKRKFFSRSTFSSWSHSNNFIYSIKSDQLALLSSTSKTQIKIDFFLSKSLILDCTLDAQPFKSQKCSVIYVMVNRFDHPKVDLSKEYDEPQLNFIEEILDQVRKYHDEQESSIKFVQPDKLYPTLRNYQKKAVQWMLKREKRNAKPDKEIKPKPHPLWLFNEYLDLQYNFYGGFFRSSKEEMILSPNALGGILADEMGLGKTVEILALILSHPRPKSTIKAPDIKQDKGKTQPKRYLCRCGVKQKTKDLTPITCVRCGSIQHEQCIGFDSSKWKHLPYYCPNCWDDPNMSKIESRATFIITPTSIHHQWKQEICKHVDTSGLKVLEYEGVSKTYIHPYELADNDIVLTSYETLASELKYVDLPKEERLRRPKRFNLPPTSLPAINWWRVVLDEAQMVESVSSNAATMAGILSAINHWCVTGTPIQKSVNDLYGLILFIGEEPYCSQLWWKLLIADPYCKADFEPLTNLLKECFWRNTKNDVAHELGLPERTEHIIRVNLAPIEKHFYVRQKERCLRMFAESCRGFYFKDLHVSLKRIDANSCTSLMNPLLKLRQACCHPQIAGTQIMTMSKKTMTMEEVLNTMLKRTTYECEEDHRKLIAALNGQAGIHIIKEELPKAVEIYRNVLTSIENFKDKFRTDKLQLYHALYNLADILKTIKENSSVTIDVSDDTDNESKDQIGSTLRDDNLGNEADAIRNEYLAVADTAIQEAQNQLNTIMENTSSQISLLTSKWWIKALDIIIDNDEEALLMSRLKEGLQERALRSLVKQGKVYKYLIEKHREISGLQYIIVTGLDELKMARQTLVKSVIKMNTKPNHKELNQAIECHLRPDKDEEGNTVPGPKCSYCLIHEYFNNYEGKLYFKLASQKISRKRRFAEEEDEPEPEPEPEVNVLEEQRKGNWSKSEIEQVLKTISTLISRQTEATEVQDQAKKVMELFELLKKEFRALRSVWVSIFDYVSRLDELNMATIRLRKIYPDEPKPDESIKYILEDHEIEPNLIQLQSDEKISKAGLNKNLSHLNFLTHLKKSNICKEGSSNPEPCPICLHLLGTNWSSLSCGHSFCLSCCNIMIITCRGGSENRGSIKCPVCRKFTKTCDVLNVATDRMNLDEETFKVEGSWSSKVEEIVRTLIRIHSKEPEDKCLIFSTWTSFLILIGRALSENGISHILADKSKNFTKQIELFKTKNIPVLLMPIHLGSKGLNLIEANHAFLVEPLLDPSHEYQAIGRIHRIGQKKATHVYRFIVNQTIEEKINEMFSLSSNYNEFSNLNENQKPTVKDIYDLLIAHESAKMDFDDE